MCEEDRSAPLSASVRCDKTRPRNFWRSYPEVVNYLLKKFVTDQAFVEYDATILRYMQPTNMTSQQIADDLIAKSCKVADVYEQSTLNDVSIEGVDASIRHSLREY